MSAISDLVRTQALELRSRYDAGQYWCVTDMNEMAVLFLAESIGHWSNGLRGFANSNSIVPDNHGDIPLLMRDLARRWADKVVRGDFRRCRADAERLIVDLTLSLIKWADWLGVVEEANRVPSRREMVGSRA